MAVERYFCDCLNVVINVNKKETRECVGRDVLSDPLKEGTKEKKVDPFFQDKLLDVNLSISGIEVSQATLSVERCYGEWVISTCLNCGLDTHALHAMKGTDRIFVSLHLHHGVEEVNEIKDSREYSSFLQLKIVGAEERHSNKMSHPSHNTITEAVEKISTTSQRLIQAEEDAKRERIRVFTDNENHNFREYKMKATRDKENLLKILRERAAQGEKGKLVVIIKSCPSQMSFHTNDSSILTNIIS